MWPRSEATRIQTPARKTQRGTSLVELIVLIVVVGIVVTAAMGALGTLSVRSADPLVQRQALAVAQSLLDEALAQPTPDGDALGPEPGESRGSATAPFNHVNDYNGYATTGIRNFDGTPVAALESYNANISVRPQAVGNVPAADGWWVEVRVTGPGGAEVVLAGWHARLSG
ncbi:MAG: type II secretion system protein [Pseudorhodobacter sp.]|nr:type II secretion system protein [Rhizobacter sp.]